MRLTVNLDEDLYRLARAHAFSERMSVSRAVNILLRKAVADEGPRVGARGSRGPLQPEGRRRFPVSAGVRRVTTADVERIEAAEDPRPGAAGGPGA